MKKKCLALITTIILSFSLSTPSFASTYVPSQSIQKNLEINGCSFTISEQTNQAYFTTRTYSAPSERSSQSLDSISSLLVGLGMDENTVANLSPETLQTYATSNHISVTTSYSKCNAETGEITYLPADVAISAAEELSARQTDYYLNYINNPESTVSTYGLKPNQSADGGVFLDSYMKITHSAASQSNGVIEFYTNAKWLTMPAFRGTDSIGSTSLDCTVTANSGLCKIKYIESDVATGYETIRRQKSQTLTGTNIKTVTKDGWVGAAVSFTLPKNELTDGVGSSNYIYSDYEVDFTYKGHIVSPSQPRWFFSAATYDHSTLNLSFGDPTISIDTNGNLTGSIGIHLSRNCDTRMASDEFYYPGR